MPVTAKIRVFERHYHDVPDPGRDRLLATRAYVGLDCLKRLHDPHLSPVSQRSCELRKAIPGLLRPSGATCHPYIVGSPEADAKQLTTRPVTLWNG